MGFQTHDGVPGRGGVPVIWWDTRHRWGTRHRWWGYQIGKVGYQHRDGGGYQTGGGIPDAGGVPHMG